MTRTAKKKALLLTPVNPDIRNAPKDKPCLTWEEWGKTYGPIVYMNVIGKPYIIINSYEIARELLEKRGQKYSDRPRFVMAGELVGKSTTRPPVPPSLSVSLGNGGCVETPVLTFVSFLLGLGIQTALAPFGPLWKRHRKFFASALPPAVVAKNYSSIHERKSYQFIQYCLDRPTEYRQNIKRFVRFYKHV